LRTLRYSWCRRPDSNPHKNHVGFVCAYDEADTYVVQSGNVHLSFFKDEFKEFARALYEALMVIERGKEPVVRALHTV